MKKSIIIAGIIILTIVIMGIIFKRLHWPGAGIMYTLGILLFSVVFIPAFIVSLAKQMKVEGSRISSIFLFFGFTGIIAFTFGGLAKLMHWPGANFGLLGGIGLLSFGLLLFMLLNRKENGRVSMISVLIVVILLGSFSFNIFRSGNIRNVNEGCAINGASFFESSQIFRKECDKLINEKLIADSLSSYSIGRNDLLKLHLLAQETELLINGMLEKIWFAENKALDGLEPGGKSSGNRDLWDQIFSILMSDEGLPMLDRKMSDYRNFILSLEGLPSDEIANITADLIYPFRQENAGIQNIYLFVNEFGPEVSINALLLWRSKVWETEYKILDHFINTKL